LTRLPTGVPGLDEVLGGGLFRGAIYIVTGSPGAGKTILGSQICCEHVRRGGQATFVTLLAESHGRMLANLQTLSFFDAAAVGQSLHYVSGFAALESGGLAGLLDLLRQTIRKQETGLLVLDGMLTTGLLASSQVDYKKFIHELQTWVAVLGCTVLFLTSARPGDSSTPEHTMVDGIFELHAAQVRLQALRELRVSKFRGSGYMEGSHTYRISSGGVRVYPRLEVALSPKGLEGPSQRVDMGCKRLDELLGGGVRQGSTTLLVGSSGSGKTVLGLQFLAAGIARKERVLHFGFYEPMHDLITKANRLGFDFDAAVARQLFHMVWQSPAEQVLDDLGYRLLWAVRSSGAKRVLIDGLVGFKEAAYQERLAGFFAVLSHELASMGVTTVITEETRELFVRRIEIPTSGVSAIFHNIVFLRQVERGSELLRLLTVMKTRDSAHDRGLYQVDITDRGLRVGERFRPSEAILTGVSASRWSPATAGPAEGESAGSD
jgi:circadian clock protein KaiC